MNKDYLNTIFPQELATVPAKFAIDKRNRFLIKNSDIVVTHVKHIGGASKFKEISEKQNKIVIDISN